MTKWRGRALSEPVLTATFCCLAVAWYIAGWQAVFIALWFNLALSFSVIPDLAPARRLLAWYVVRLLPQDARQDARVQLDQLLNAPKQFFEVFDEIWDQARANLPAALIRAVTQVGFVLGLMYAFANSTLEALRPLSEFQRLEFGAVVGTFVVVLLATARGSTHVKSPYTHNCTIFSGLALASLAVAGAFFFIPGLVAAHVWPVFSANGFMCAFDWFAAQGDAKNRELKELLVVMDCPLLIALGFSIWYVHEREEMLGHETAEAVLAGMIAMQFLMSVLLYTAVETQVASKLPPRRRA